MNSRQKEVLQSELNNEKKTIKELEQVYTQAVKDCEQKIRELSMRTDMENLQSIVYQKQYQQAIKGQLEGALSQLHSNEFATVSEYLNKCYTTGYVGSMYDLAGQGIPLVVPINQNQVAKAIQIDSKLSKTLYDSLGEDVKKLKTAVRAQVSRGIANGSSWNEIGRTLAERNMKNTPFGTAINNATRIARTEGHRVQTSAKMDAMSEAKKKGADVVKQWDSTLDGRTRTTHRQLDGQIRELDEPFEVDGMKVDAPGMFGNPAEDCNCRCTILQRARWELDESELAALKERAEYYGLDKTENFEDFKGKYLQASAIVQNQQSVSSNFGNISDYNELENYFQKEYNINIDDSIKKLNFEDVKNTLSGAESAFREFPELANNITVIKADKGGVMSCTGKEINFNPQYYTSQGTVEKLCKQYEGDWWVRNASLDSIAYHECAHAVEQLMIDANSAYTYPFERTIAWNKCTEAKSIVSEACKNIKKTPYGKGKKNAELISNISRYAADNASETMAEAFADIYANGENAQELSKEIKRLTIETLNKYKGVTP